MVLPYLHIRCQEYTPNTEGDHLNVTSNNFQHPLCKVGAGGSVLEKAPPLTK